MGLALSIFQLIVSIKITNRRCSEYKMDVQQSKHTCLYAELYVLSMTFKISFMKPSSDVML